MTKKTRSEIAKASRRKGKRGERQLALLMEKWWGCKFHRTPGSGALRWDHLAEQTRGDIVSVDPNFPFCIEEKNRESWNHQAFFEGKGSIFVWWNQCIKDARAVNRIPLLFVTKNYCPYYVIYKQKDIKPFYSHIPKHRLYTCHEKTGNTLIMVPLRCFFLTIKKEAFLDH